MPDKVTAHLRKLLRKTGGGHDIHAPFRVTAHRGHTVQTFKSLELAAIVRQERSVVLDTVSAVVVPSAINAAHVIDVAFRRYNLALGSGLNKVAGKVYRSKYRTRISRRRCSKSRSLDVSPTLEAPVTNSS